MMTEDQIRQSFVRQRRSLIVISLVLLFIQFGEVTIQEIKAIETTLLINHPNAVNWALWIAYFYWLYRYYVYFHDIGDKGFHEMHRAWLMVLVLRWAKKKFSTDSTWKNTRIENIIGLMKKRDPTRSERITNDLQNPHEWKLADGPETGLLGVTHFQVIPVRLTLMLYVKRDDQEWSIQHQGHDQVDIEGFEAIKLNSKASAHVLIHTRILSEYYLPFLIALTPVVYFLLAM